MSSGDIATYIAIALPLGAFFTWILRHYLAELKPNGGSSLNDTIKLEILPMIKEMRDDVTEVKVSLAKLEGRFEQHVEEGE
jgi:hypothetical protein